ncbi:unnamed protein product [Soboliphyme baturini]|uniref:C2H2-type domain-containing protein n=1 Tax=Soboliphyme baturini TaxID=241478 RepID=A0A183IIT6_9BILA|nr:unnamed protein product [Soboliphyme baturini]
MLIFRTITLFGIEKRDIGLEINADRITKPLQRYYNAERDHRRTGDEACGGLGVLSEKRSFSFTFTSYEDHAGDAIEKRRQPQSACHASVASPALVIWLTVLSMATLGEDIAKHEQQWTEKRDHYKVGHRVYETDPCLRVSDPLVACSTSKVMNHRIARGPHQVFALTKNCASCFSSEKHIAFVQHIRLLGTVRWSFQRPCLKLRVSEYQTVLRVSHVASGALAREDLGAVKEKELSLRCVQAFNGDKSFCADEFLNYTTCRTNLVTIARIS